MTSASHLRLLGLAVAGGSLVPRPVLTHLPTICPIRRITGYPCPSCGMVRSWHSVLRLDPVQAIRDHPFGPIAIAALTAEAWRPGAVERAMRGLPPGANAVATIAWFGWWGSRLLAAHRARPW